MELAEKVSQSSVAVGISTVIVGGMKRSCLNYVCYGLAATDKMYCFKE